MIAEMSVCIGQLNRRYLFYLKSYKKYCLAIKRYDEDMKYRGYGFGYKRSGFGYIKLALAEEAKELGLKPGESPYSAFLQKELGEH